MFTNYPENPISDPTLCLILNNLWSVFTKLKVIPISWDEILDQVLFEHYDILVMKDCNNYSLKNDLRPFITGTSTNPEIEIILDHDRIISELGALFPISDVVCVFQLEVDVKLPDAANFTLELNHLSHPIDAAHSGYKVLKSKVGEQLWL